MPNAAPESSTLHSREHLAGYDRDRLENAVVLLAGAGAAGNNLALHLALVGVGELRIVDPDVIEPSNLTRSPLFRPSTSNKPRAKARELATAFLARSYASDPIVRYAPDKIEALGRGAFLDVDVVVSAVDRFDARAYLADTTRLLGIPLVEVGFRYPAGHITVFPNQDADEPCFRCLYPDLPLGGVSCRLYAQQAVDVGATPNTQSIAALSTAFVAEAVIQAIHETFPLRGSQLAFDVLTGASRTTKITRDLDCPGQHRLYTQIEEVATGLKDPLSSLFDPEGGEATLRLPQPFVVTAPCAKCGAAVPVKCPLYSLERAPSCTVCPDVAQFGERRLELIQDVGGSSIEAGRSLKNLGLRPLDLIELWEGSACRPLRLPGELSALFHEKTPRRSRNKTAPPSMGNNESTERANELHVEPQHEQE